MEDLEKSTDAALPDSKVNDVKKDEFVHQMMQQFDQLDIDGDGNIDFSEYVRNAWDADPDEALSSSSITLRQLRRQFKSCDLNRDGKISREEFKVLAENTYYELFLKKK